MDSMSTEMPIVQFRAPAEMKAELFDRVPPGQRGEVLRQMLDAYLRKRNP